MVRNWHNNTPGSAWSDDSAAFLYLMPELACIIERHMGGTTTTEAFSDGARWHRWDPHLHAPGTLLNDQFGGIGAWESFLEKLETSAPTIEAVGLEEIRGI
jgi:hypothetical protein